MVTAWAFEAISTETLRNKDEDKSLYRKTRRSRRQLRRYLL